MGRKCKNRALLLLTKGGKAETVRKYCGEGRQGKTVLDENVLKRRQRKREGYRKKKERERKKEEEGRREKKREERGVRVAREWLAIAATVSLHERVRMDRRETRDLD